MFIDNSQVRVYVALDGDLIEPGSEMTLAEIILNLHYSINEEDWLDENILRARSN